ncbi:MAG: nuclease [Acidobacteriaceae bacterium]
MMRVGLAVAVGCLVVGMGGARMRAQEQGARVMGTVATKDALVTGGLEVKGDQARLMSNTSVTAYDHTAEVKLERGGDVLVCATSQFHLLSIGAGTGKSLLFGLDRGALELHTPTETRDVILTPDIRFTVEAKGSYDLRVRVTRDGDTCVENAGKKAPVLMLNDAFSRASYRVLPGQHVLFEHGDLRQVVDNERSPCGCPAGVTTEQLAANASAAEKAAAAHPFPAAASEGLAATEPVANSPVGEKETQVSTSLSYAAGQGTSASAVETPEQVIADAGTRPAQTAKVKHSFGYKLKRFFYRLFHPGSSK